MPAIPLCPEPAGAKVATRSYSRQTQLLYTPVVDACATFKLIGTEFREGMPYWGEDATVAPAQVRGGAVKAFDPTTGREVWSWTSRGIRWCRLSNTHQIKQAHHFGRFCQASRKSCRAIVL